MKKSELLRIIDRELLDSSMFGCHPCDNRATVAMTTNDFVNSLLCALGYTVTYVTLPIEE